MLRFSSVQQDIAVRQSMIEGLGVFALRPFKEGEVVLRWNPTLLHLDDAQRIPQGEQRYLLFESDGTVLYMQSPERFVNHSCHPNTVARDRCDIALRAIEVGEEITSTYSGNGAVTFRCHCGSHQCKGMVRG